MAGHPWFAILAAASLLPAQAGKGGDKQDPSLAVLVREFRQWLDDYKRGAVRFVKDHRVDEQTVAAVDARMAALAQTNVFRAAELLFAAATVVPAVATATSTDAIDVQRELQPWRVQALAQRHLRSMSHPEVLPWLLRMLRAPEMRTTKPGDSMRHAKAALLVLTGHRDPAVQQALVAATRTLPAELRPVAVAALSHGATLDLVPTILELVRDAEPNVRIGAVNAVAATLQPAVDESLGMKPAGGLLQLRDQVIARFEQLLVQDQVWQVRSAAAFALATMKCKAIVPVLIKGLEAELGRKQDPWAMDVRLHKLLEGLTGQSVVRGQIAPWKEFWAKEGPSFAVRPQGLPGAPKQDTRYEKFFDLEIESDRVLFVLDFSGSMAEPAVIRSTATGAPPGVQSTKAELVVRELKRLVMSLPDGAHVNFIVFGDEVRVWRQVGNRPTLVKLDDQSRDDLVGSFFDSLQPAGATNLYGALDVALEFGGRGLYDKYYAAGFDTLYVISDGAPTAGAVTDKDEIRKRVREANGLRKIAIHCITFGDKNDTEFLRPMAEENGGRHIHVD